MAVAPKNSAFGPTLNAADETRVAVGRLVVLLSLLHLA